jgi:hypothetical protein
MTILDVLVAILPVFAYFIATILPVLLSLIAKTFSRRQSILQIVAPFLRRVETIRSIANAYSIAGARTLSNSRSITRAGPIPQARQNGATTTRQPRTRTRAWSLSRRQLTDAWPLRDT